MHEFLRGPRRVARRAVAWAAIALTTVASASVAAAQDVEPPADEGAPPASEPTESTPEESAPAAEGPGDSESADAEPTPDARTPRERELEARIVELEAAVSGLVDRVQTVEEDQQFAEETAERRSRESLHIGGYGDVGAFYVTGDGSGIRPDTGHALYPEFAGDIPDSWVFVGDPLSTAINARGEPADTGPSRAVAFDPVDSRGGFSLLVNSLTLNGFAALADDLTVNWKVDFLPRRRDVSDPGGAGFGDYVDVRLAYMEYRGTLPELDVAFAVGKIDSVLGVEYRTQDAPDRMEVTPSLLCRYTCGRPIGLRARFRFLEERSLILNVAVTNGTHFSELFPFNADVDVNQVVTGAGRLSYTLPIGPGIEIGVSGAVGPQDMQSSDEVVQWHVGADLLADWDDLYFAAEFVMGEAPGVTEVGDVQCGLAPCLTYRGAYGRIGYRFLNWLMPYVRADWREATHRDGASYVYLSHLVRFTGGFRFDISANVLLKIEYTANVELTRGSQFDNDVFTSSLVARF